MSLDGKLQEEKVRGWAFCNSVAFVSTWLVLACEGWWGNLVKGFILDLQVCAKPGSSVLRQN